MTATDARAACSRKSRGARAVLVASVAGLLFSGCATKAEVQVLRDDLKATTIALQDLKSQFQDTLGDRDYLRTGEPLRLRRQQDDSPVGLENGFNLATHGDNFKVWCADVILEAAYQEFFPQTVMTKLELNRSSYFIRIGDRYVALSGNVLGWTDSRVGRARATPFLLDADEGQFVKNRTTSMYLRYGEVWLVAARAGLVATTPNRAGATSLVLERTRLQNDATTPQAPCK